MHQICNRHSLRAKIQDYYTTSKLAPWRCIFDRFQLFSPVLHWHWCSYRQSPRIVGQHCGNFARDFLEKAKIDITIRLLGMGTAIKNDCELSTPFLDAAA